ncbi:MAG: long-chain fatty acid--CoA ligase [Leptospiraceae bacterium]|nr:long-chain fatty acid--CoA ligase [Leptospiraceae bacterium]MCP5495394.1 long-chain fatty acid--CoA ligase [Leptospiraceae bacterium]
MSDYKTLNEMFQYTLKKFGNNKVFFSKNSNKKFEGISFVETYRLAENLALSLYELGLKPGDKVALIADNRLEWTIADMAILLNGACDVPRGTDSTPQEIQFIIEHSETKFCFIENEKILKNISTFLESIDLKKIIIMDKKFRSNDDKIVGLYTLIDRGEKLRNSLLYDLKIRTKNVTEDDLYTIIYTSGTTGTPKGVMLTHKNMVFNITAVNPMVGVKSKDRALSILPVWHVFERAVMYLLMANGSGIYYTNVRDLREDFLKVKPTFMASAPRLWENLYLGIKSKLEKSEPYRQFLFNTGFEVSKMFKQGLDYLQGKNLKQNKESDVEIMGNTALSLFGAVNLYLPSKAFDMLLFSKIREALGGEMRATISGGGALPPHVDEFFNIIGIPVLEGYGMTECSPVISCRHKDKVVQGTVGLPLKGCEVKILNDKGGEVEIGELGVIHVKGPQVMKGYYKNEEATKNVLKEGWLNTGDLGFFSHNGMLSVRGRVKDTIVLLGGENVEPAPIENLLIEDSFISQVIVVGQDRKYLTALIWPNYDKLKENRFSVNDEKGDLNKNVEVRQHYMNILKSTVSSANGFKSFEKVNDFRFLPKPFEVGVEITSLYKMKRKVIHEKYESLIASMYI